MTRRKVSWNAESTLADTEDYVCPADGCVWRTSNLLDEECPVCPSMTDHLMFEHGWSFEEVEDYLGEKEPGVLLDVDS